MIKLMPSNIDKEIHHPVGQRRHLRELIMAYHDTNKSILQVKNKIKAKFL